MSEGQPNFEPALEENSEREKQWLAFVERFKIETDGLGYGIEKGIIDSVVGLNALGFNTSQSCEGHTDRGRIAPWIDIQAPDEPKQYIDQDKIYQEVAKDFNLSVEEVERSIDDAGTKAWVEAQERLDKQDETLEYIAWRKRSKELGHEINKMLKEFNNGRNVSKSIRIKISTGRFDSTLYNGGKDYWSQEKKRTEKQKENLEKRLIKYREEFQKFAEFLKDKFFAE